MKKWEKTHWNIYARTINGLPEKLMNIRYLMWFITDPLSRSLCVCARDLNIITSSLDATVFFSLAMCVCEIIFAWLVKVNQ